MTSILHLVNWFSTINLENFQTKSILIIGSGYIAKEYCKILEFIKCQNVVILGNSEESTKKLASEFNFEYIFGGFEGKLSTIEKKDLVIICTPIHLLLDATKLSLQSGQKNILIEKPGSLYPEKLLQLNEQIDDQILKIAFNRLFYSSQLHLKKLIENEEITSCHFQFTEWIHTINFEKYQKDAYLRWGISNSLHVIGMAFNIMDTPQKLYNFQQGELEWHPTGTIFTGSGLSKKSIPFSYHADWKSSGRWGIEIFTNNNIYSLRPLETLSVYDHHYHRWNTIKTESVFPNLKPGLGEQVIMMLSDNNSIKNNLMSLLDTSSLIKMAEQIFGYK